MMWWIRRTAARAALPCPSTRLIVCFAARDCLTRSNAELERYIGGLETELDRHEEEQAMRKFAYVLWILLLLLGGGVSVWL